MISTEDAHLREMANAIRALAMDAVQKAKSGHPGAPMGMADLATVLYARHLRFDPSAPDWFNRDRFVLSNGHGSMLLYALNYLTGYADMTIEELTNFRQLHSRTPGHPEYGHASGVETTTGPLGQGLANAVGMAIAERHLAAEFGDDLIGHDTYVFAGDGCLMEGISHEAASLAGHLRLQRLIVLFDDNSISIDGPTSLAVSDDQCARFVAYGWATRHVDGHDFAAIDQAISWAKSNDRPTLLACKTQIGFGSPNKAGTAAAHGNPLGDDEIAATRERLGWPHPPFEVPEHLLQAWRGLGERGRADRRDWEGRLAAAVPDVRTEFERRAAGRLPAHFGKAVADLKESIARERPTLATRKASQNALEMLTAAAPELIGGSADLTGSNNTKTAATEPMEAGAYGGRYIYYGVREHAMAAAMNGMALHGGVIPYGGTFLTFTDYCRPAIRLAALMGLRVVFVMTHDSIGLGEDGPTHQPVEHLAALRAIPNLAVFRPADAVETLECWEAALQRADGPSVIALTRQNLPALRQAHLEENQCARGAYVIAAARGEPRATILATGSEVEIAVAAQEKLRATGVEAAVVSMPSQELFGGQPGEYQRAVLAAGPCVAVEAGVPLGWTRFVDDDADFVGMRSFGASAPYKQLYEHFRITADAVVAAVRRRLER